MKNTSNPPLVHLLTVVDGQTEELVEFLELKGFELDVFARQFAVDLQADPEMRDRYAVGPDDVAFICNIVGRELHFEFNRYAYFIEAARKE